MQGCPPGEGVLQRFPTPLQSSTWPVQHRPGGTRYGNQPIACRRNDSLKRAGARRFVAVSFGLSRVIPQRVFGILQSLVHGVAHRSNPWTVRKDDSVGTFDAIYQRRIFTHRLALQFVQPTS